jgi:hypothetical protein
MNFMEPRKTCSGLRWRSTVRRYGGPAVLLAELRFSTASAAARDGYSRFSFSMLKPGSSGCFNNFNAVDYSGLPWSNFPGNFDRWTIRVRGAMRDDLRAMENRLKSPEPDTTVFEEPLAWATSFRMSMQTVRELSGAPVRRTRVVIRR